MGLKKLQKPSVDEIIDRGGKVCSDQSSQKYWVNFTLRIPKSLLEEIDEKLQERIGISKTGWILETIQKRLREF